MNNTDQVKKNTKNIFTLLHPSTRNDLFHPSRFLYAIVFATLFAAFGYFAPRVWTQYSDYPQYYSVKQPVSVDREIYKQGDKLVATAVRTSLLNVAAHSTVQIYLVTSTGEIVKRNPLFDGNVIVEKTQEAVVHLTYTIPYDLPNGKYYIKAIITYPIYDTIKSYTWFTQAFTVDDKLTE